VREEIQERNAASRARLVALGSRLSDDELASTIDPPWTAAGLFAHLAFWDRFVRERWDLARRREERTPMAVDDGLMDRINDASLEQWMAIPPGAAVAACVRAAEELDALLDGVDDNIADELVAEGRERLIDRSLHREDHLRTLEAAFPAAD
jgi:hypothetical protein